MRKEIRQPQYSRIDFTKTLKIITLSLNLKLNLSLNLNSSQPKPQPLFL